MTQKNLGPLVSGYLDTDQRSFETAVFQSGRPVLDKELNLVEDLANGVGQTLLRKTAASGWLAQEFLDSTASGVFIASLVANELKVPPLHQAFVNGWVLRVTDTGGSGVNVIDLGSAPTPTGSSRIDLVILEVWRRLISPNPSTSGKPTSSTIWRNGNVKGAVTLADDIQDGVLGSESTKRVQIQYRLRVVQDVDLLANPLAMTDPAVVANTVPTGPSLIQADGTPTLFSYAASSTDCGLWVAGDGNPANTLGTVDGFMYAVPMVAVFRRNQVAFDKNSNHNGGSGRPDGLTHDIISMDDVIDLRTGTTLTGWNYEEVLQRNLTYLFDNNLKTEITQTIDGANCIGHTVFAADEIGIITGDNIDTGDTPGATFIGQFDSARRTFSARSVYEVITVQATRSGGGNWILGDVVQLAASTLNIYPYTGVPFTNRFPAGTHIMDVLAARFIGSASGKTSRDAVLTQVDGLNEAAPSNINLTLGAIPSGVTDEAIYVDLLVAYPPGSGLSRTPVSTFGSNTYQINNPGVLTPSPYNFSALTNLSVDRDHREVTLMYTTTPLTITLTAEGSGSSTVVRMPERVKSGTTVTVVNTTTSTTYTGAQVTISSDGRTLTISGVTSPGDVLTVTYTAVRPMPDNSGQMTIFYQTRAPQSVRYASLQPTLSVVPRYISPYLYILTQGPSSPDSGFPFPQAYVQTGGIFKGLSDPNPYLETELSGTASISLADFSARTGMLRVLANVPYTPNPEEVSFNTPGVDGESRSYYSVAQSGVYVPSAFGQVLSYEKRHKVILPMIVELAADTPFARTGTLLLMLITRWASFDNGNFVAFDSNANINTTAASIFRIKGNLLNRGS